MKDGWASDNLVRLAIGGDRPSFEKLLILQYPRLLERASRMLPMDVLRHTSAEDVRQLAACEAWLHIQSLKIESMGGFCRWLDGVMLNCIRYTLRQHHALKRGGGVGRDGEASLDANRLLEFLGRNTKSPRTAMAHQELLELLEAVLAAMDADHRLALRYRYLEGRSHEEVAQLLNCTKINARQKCTRALRAIRELMPLSSGERKRLSQ